MSRDLSSAFKASPGKGLTIVCFYCHPSSHLSHIVQRHDCLVSQSQGQLPGYHQTHSSITINWLYAYSTPFLLCRSAFSVFRAVGLRFIVRLRLNLEAAISLADRIPPPAFHLHHVVVQRPQCLIIHGVKIELNLFRPSAPPMASLFNDVDCACTCRAGFGSQTR